MCRVLFYVTLFVFGLGFQGGNGTLECPMPPLNLAVYFDLSQISSFATQPDLAGLIGSPVTCKAGNDEDCATQRCCGTDEGCCISDSGSGNGKCGCRGEENPTCSDPPMAVLGKTECNAENKRRIVTCLRKRRNEDDGFLGINFNQQGFVEPNTNLNKIPTTTLQKETLEIDVNQDDLIRHSIEAKNIFLQQFSLEELADSLSKKMIDTLFEHVTERISKGQSYGLAE